MRCLCLPQRSYFNANQYCNPDEEDLAEPEPEPDLMGLSIHTNTTSNKQYC